MLGAGGDDVPVHPGASAPCARLFEVTLRGPREETAADPAAAVGRLTTRFGVPAGGPPASWQMTIADVAADLDVIDLPAFVESWARSVAQDWSA